MAPGNLERVDTLEWCRWLEAMVEKARITLLLVKGIAVVRDNNVGLIEQAPEFAEHGLLAHVLLGMDKCFPLPQPLMGEA